MALLTSEIRCLTKAEHEELLQDAQLPVVIPTEHALAVKADLEIPWNNLRILRRYELNKVKTIIITIIIVLINK